MNDRDAYNLMANALLRVSKAVDAANDDDDADPWLCLEDIKYLCDDVIEHVSRERGPLVP